jgi:hypothetical protein
MSWSLNRGLLVRIDGKKALSGAKSPGGFMDKKTRFFVGLAILCIVDAVIPVPIVGLILLFVLLQRSPWFYTLVREVYDAPK